jgi:hypothetical protein
MAGLATTYLNALDDSTISVFGSRRREADQGGLHRRAAGNQKECRRHCLNCLGGARRDRRGRGDWQVVWQSTLTIRDSQHE